MNRTTRAGMLLLDVALATALLGTLLIVALNAQGTMSMQRRAAEHRALALQEAANTMERLAALPWDQLTEANLAEMKISDATARSLPGGKLTARVADSTDPVPGRRISVEVAWNAPGSQKQPCITLTSWRYLSRSAAP